MLDTPVLFLIFNRPDTTVQVFDRIRQAAPRQLFIAADGPRPDKPEDIERCRQVQKIVGNIDWECEVKTLFRNENLGCGLAVSEAVTWFFENVQQGIILEDDTVPDLSFFSFCAEMLDFHKYNEQIMHVSGTSFLKQVPSSNMSHYCSRYPNIWGWASWARAWKYYDFRLSKFENLDSVMRNSVHTLTAKEMSYWESIFLNLKLNIRSTWDYQWLFCVWNKSGICITPTANMVSNIGFGQDGTHTHNPDWEIAGLPVYRIKIPLKHIAELKINERNDLETFNRVYGVETSFANKMRNLFYKIVPYEKRKRYLGI